MAMATGAAMGNDTAVHRVESDSHGSPNGTPLGTMKFVGTSASRTGCQPEAGKLQQCVDMGFDRELSRKWLSVAYGDVENAVDAMMNGEILPEMLPFDAAVSNLCMLLAGRVSRTKCASCLLYTSPSPRD